MSPATQSPQDIIERLQCQREILIQALGESQDIAQELDMLKATRAEVFEECAIIAEAARDELVNVDGRLGAQLIVTRLRARIPQEPRK